MADVVESTDMNLKDVVFKLCDRNENMIAAWKTEFEEHIASNRVQVCESRDIFKDRAPCADAIVSPANSFGFMDGGIDMAYSKHFGWQLQRRLQEVIRKEKHGELLVGDAVIIPTFEHGIDSEEVQELQKRDDWAKCNEGQPIKFMISAPTMRVPLDVSKTVNAYSTFRAVIIAVSQHNETAEGTDQIRSVLCPGLGTAVGTMPHQRCAHQMRKALEMYVLGRDEHIKNPKDLGTVWKEHDDMTEFGHADIPPPPKEGKVQKWSLFGLF